MKDCGCCSLETGGFIIGILEIIEGVIGIILTGSILTLGIVAGQVLDQQNSQVGGGLALDDAVRQQVDFAVVLVKVISTILLVTSCIQVILASALIHGIRKKSIQLMTIWMTFKVTFIIVLVVLFLISCFETISTSSIVYYLVSIGLSSFYVQVIYDLRKEYLSAPVPPNHIVQSSNNGIPIYMNMHKVEKV